MRLRLVVKVGRNFCSLCDSGTIATDELVWEMFVRIPGCLYLPFERLDFTQ